MSNLLASLRSSTTSLAAITEAVAIIQNNVTNAGTAGYAKQRVSLQAVEFDAKGGLAGGVSNVEGKALGMNSRNVWYAGSPDARLRQNGSTLADPPGADLSAFEWGFDPIDHEPAFSGVLGMGSIPERSGREGQCGCGRFESGGGVSNTSSS